MTNHTSKLQLDRPIVFFDLETTGTNISQDRIVEIAMLKVFPDGSEEEYRTLVNPERPIPPATTDIHHISDADVADAPTFKEISGQVAGFIEDADLGGYNCNRFDIPMLVEELLRAEVPIDLTDRKVIDVQVIFHKKEQRTLTAAYKFYCNRELDNAHSADADTRATYEVLKGQLEMYNDLPTDVDALDEYTTQRKVVDFAGRFAYDDNGEIVFNFGKYRGQNAIRILKLEPGYFDWMMKGDFPRDTKRALMRIKMMADGQN